MASLVIRLISLFLIVNNVEGQFGEIASIGNFGYIDF
jgi:hypothetical protein